MLDVSVFGVMFRGLFSVDLLYCFSQTSVHCVSSFITSSLLWCEVSVPELCVSWHISKITCPNFMGDNSKIKNKKSVKTDELVQVLEHEGNHEGNQPLILSPSQPALAMLCLSCCIDITEPTNWLSFYYPKGVESWVDLGAAVWVCSIEHVYNDIKTNAGIGNFVVQTSLLVVGWDASRSLLSGCEECNHLG